MPPAAPSPGEAHPSPQQPASDAEPRSPGAPSDDDASLDEGFLAGTVVARDGRPVAGVELYLVLPESEDDDGPLPHSTRSRKDGSFLLASSQPGPHTVRLYHRDFLLTELSVTFPAEGARLVLRDGASLEVEVLDEAGLPVAGSEVQLVERHGAHFTDGSGKVTLRGHPPGRYRVVAEFRPAALGPIRFDVPVAASLDVAALVLAAGAMLALLRFHVGLVPVLAGAAVLGAAWKLVA